MITGADGEAVETVGEVHRVGRPDDDERAEHHKEPAEIDHQFLEERKGQRGSERRPAKTRNREAGEQRDHSFEGEPRAT